jgi:general stress protein YciG
MAKRGFALLPKGKVSEIASKGGVAAHVKGTAHEFTSEEAWAAGRKGGLAVHRKKKAVEQKEQAVPALQLTFSCEVPPANPTDDAPASDNGTPA